ncbi:MFS general substrate transporter [Cryphonectria parasitica EP155]|uniref:MFS general substrate transporter n=1 Tax=Cryphonectria parasitica (strain ATCC 38755 / EP155) TaxID=660469 RepID=A0A9P4YAB5_CRYP1|nr:MFS general substrate transporter [Cryphonectria parasitica EP155]KAF3769360.1 MFS general substrate transporter [Cryphonectria parasitica EP155]
MESPGSASKKATSEEEYQVEANAVRSLSGVENPVNWSILSKWVYTGIVVGMAGIVGFSSSVHTPAIHAIAEDFNTSRTASTLGATMYLIGFGFGPFLFAPLAEVLGRNFIYYSTFLAFCLANLGCALSPNIAAFLIFRFIAGFSGSPSVANSGGSIIDMWPDSQRSVPLAFFTVASFCGPVLAPIIGGILTQYVSWRWNFWVVLIVSGAIYCLAVIALPETYPPKLLQQKLEREERFKSGFVGQHRQSLKTRFAVSLTRPWIMLFTEPILISLSLYMAFIYGVLFLDFTAYPVVFQNTRGWSLSISGLSFLGIGLGMALAATLSPLVNRVHAHYVRKLGALGGSQPEARLPHLIIVAWLLPLGLFWFGWTALPPTPWEWSVVAGVPFGFGLVMLFLGITAYLTDCYAEYSTSALAANSLLRSLFGAGFAVFAEDMYETMGTPWATSVLGFVALAMALLPLVFFKYGARVRGVSKFHLATIGHSRQVA